ncbi:YbaB/EbfC family nucleoid-associated protein [Prosthecomicrobium hirschii]|uniref:Nucleoid-associated protein ABB55_12910 n=1 Tax=Prosthecodimorpha hirschii TaxID=665126 RepID=A0A0P6W6N6_9HYPH|nr:YbaB/EbfC family nucleoid-associated protein [Prosthecomicrobium hirschii]KPL53006.1 nucleoid-associated protein [Prosthecomicrobium hirschii]MCW1841984.1 YbaB/EbfC family nucleoid-associated protein [Prosthecomicrobium hirschii]TPQ51441.1 nucleoid-associated protein, YbaB/EbfC family [Prosthecomicrobium hirschii]
MDFLKMMKQAKDMQARMAGLQDELATIEVSGASGAGLVTVTVSGKGEMRSVKIDPSLLKPEDAEILEDLIVAAHRDAHAKAEAAIAAKMAELTGGLGLPAGFKLPF